MVIMLATLIIFFLSALSKCGKISRNVRGALSYLSQIEANGVSLNECLRIWVVFTWSVVRFYAPPHGPSGRGEEA